MSKKPNNERSKNFVIILYPENEHYNEIIEQIKNCKYAYIEHDKDKWTDDKVNGTMKEYCAEHNIQVGDPVKTHDHIVLMFDSQRWLSALRNEFINIPPNDIQVCHNLRGAIRYLTHCDNPTKTPYGISEIKTNVMNIVSKQYLDEIDSDRIASGIYNFINDNLDYCDETDVYKYLQAIGHPSYYPRYRNLIIDLLKNRSKKMTYSKEYKNLLHIIRTSFDALTEKLTSPNDKKQVIELEQTILNFVDDTYKYKDK